MKLAWESIKQDAMKEQMIYSEECKRLGRPCYITCHLYPPLTFHLLLFFSDHYIVTCSGVNLKSLVDAAENYQTLLAENRKLFNEVQELKGGIYMCLWNR